MSTSDTLHIPERTSSHPRYDAYKDSGVEWLGEIPEHWQVQRLKHLATVYLSSVDKKTKDNEIPVRLCNYTDVYYGTEIEDASSFMKATATMSEIGVHRLRKGDVMITKDSESPDDIAIPAVAARDFERVICGYHLSQIRTSTQLYGKYLYYAFCDPQTNAQFEASATGITRFSISAADIKNAEFLLPPLPEQRAIAAYLDRETERIDALVAKKERLIELLEEKRTALISHAVTKGLDDGAEMKDSGVEWLGEIPAGWDATKLKFLVREIVDAEHKTAPFYPDGEYLVVRTSNIRDGELRLDDAKYTDEEGFEEWTRRGEPQSGDILFTREAPAGEACIVPEGSDLCLGQRVVLLRMKQRDIIPQFALYTLYSGLADEFVSLLSQGSTVEHFNMSDIANIPILHPPLSEQQRIATYLNNQTSQHDHLIGRIEDGIDRLKEYRTALISAAVTGQIDVRESV